MFSEELGTFKKTALEAAEIRICRFPLKRKPLCLRLSIIIISGWILSPLRKKKCVSKDVILKCFSALKVKTHISKITRILVWQLCLFAISGWCDLTPGGARVANT